MDGRAGRLCWRTSGKRGGSKAQFMAMLMDFVPEAIALGALFGHNHRAGILLALFIGAQNLPEGFNSYHEIVAGRVSSSLQRKISANRFTYSPVSLSLGHPIMTTRFFTRSLFIVAGAIGDKRHSHSFQSISIQSGRKPTNSYGWCDRHQHPHIGRSANAVRFADIRNQNISRSGGYGGVILSQELSMTFKHGDAELTFNLMRMHGQFLPGFKVEIDDLHVR
jgi:hypothetical protein